MLCKFFSPTAYTLTLLPIFGDIINGNLKVLHSVNPLNNYHKNDTIYHKSLM